MLRRVVIVGQNLARASQTTQAFLGTRSGAVLAGWLHAAGLRESLATTIKMVNVVNRKTRNNRPLKAREIRRALPALADAIEGADLVVTLGNQAAKAVLMCAHLVRREMPPATALQHPSGRNRNLNDPAVRAAQPEAIRRACAFLGI